MRPRNENLQKWVNECAALCQPDKIYWVNGTAEEAAALTREAVASGVLHELNPRKLPGCYLHRSHPNDVARTEQLTFICTSTKEEAGPTNNWMAPDEAYKKLGDLFRGSMKGRTMYVIPYVMGQIGSPFSKVGVELTDSVYVVLNMRIMCRSGQQALEQLGAEGEFVRGLHCTADLNPERRFICHFPQDNTIWSVGSGYGGNALLGKKCFSLRIAGYLARKEGWMAEHMLIMGIEDPKGQVTYLAAAFPSACGKTNLAMLVPPDSMKGYKVWTVGDDIAWMRIGPDGRLWATNPETGFFGVAPGTSLKSNPNALKTVQRNSIFTNVVQTRDNTVWWEGMDGEPPESGIDWRGKPWTPQNGEKGAHPNARFTAPAAQCPCISPHWEDPQGVPISAILFGGRRAKVAPLVYQSRDWQHGVYVGATMSSETTAAQFGSAIGVVRRDPMAMLPFCGYDMGKYLQHWLAMGKKLGRHAPKIFHVNWFRLDDSGKFIWPGFGENIRVLRWIVERCAGGGKAVETPIGALPSTEALDLRGLDLSAEALKELLTVDRAEWRKEVDDQQTIFQQLAATMPQELQAERVALAQRLQ